MRIAFIHSCLEPGKDGVGDYTRLLAEECARQGHPSCIIALNDFFVTDGPVEHGGAVPALRLGQDAPWADRIRKARAFLDAFQPDLVSLQFVCYGWHPKGIVRGVGERLREVIGSVPLHVMMHELWIGEQNAASAKERIIGAVQRHFVLHLIRSLRPDRVHTSNAAYKALLARDGVDAQLLPLFGLIPIADRGDACWIAEELNALGVKTDPGQRQQVWFFGMFGSLHPVWPSEPLFSYLRDAGKQHNRHIVILAIGRMGGGEGLWDSLAAQYPDFTFCKLGERAPQQISEFLQFVDFGLATTPWAIIEKSATVSTMLDHGLPVIVNRDELRYRYRTPKNSDARSPLLWKMQPDLATQLPNLQHQPPCSTLPDIARQMLHDLE